MSIVIRVLYRKINYRIELNSKITVVMGNSATGKTLIQRVTNGKYRDDGRVHLDDSSYELVIANGPASFDALLINKKRVFIIDEEYSDLSNEQASIIRDSVDNYFLIFARKDIKCLNYDIGSVKILATDSNGSTVVNDYIESRQVKASSFKYNFNYCITEDTTYGRSWFQQLFINTDITFDNSKEVGKEQVCSLAEKRLILGDNVLLLVDVCSFGSCSSVFRELSMVYPGKVSFISKLKSFEYLILKSNMFNSIEVSYNVQTKGFEEKYYEEVLSYISNIGNCRIKHGLTNRIPLCYTVKCCPYTERKGCNIGLSGEDKFVAMLKGTEFEMLCILSRRL